MRRGRVLSYNSEHSVRSFRTFLEESEIVRLNWKVPRKRSEISATVFELPSDFLGLFESSASNFWCSAADFFAADLKKVRGGPKKVRGGIWWSAADFLGLSLGTVLPVIMSTELDHQTVEIECAMWMDNWNINRLFTFFTLKMYNIYLKL